MADASGLEISKVYTCYRLDATRPTLHIPDPNRFFGFLLFGYIYIFFIFFPRPITTLHRKNKGRKGQCDTRVLHDSGSTLSSPSQFSYPIYNCELWTNTGQ